MPTTRDICLNSGGRYLFRPILASGYTGPPQECTILEIHETTNNTYLLRVNWTHQSGPSWHSSDEFTLIRNPGDISGWVYEATLFEGDLYVVLGNITTPN